MSKEALEYKNNNKNTDYSQMSINDLNKLPKHFGIINFKISKTSFFILNIFNDDSSAVKFFWKEHHDLDSLDIWYDICQNEGLYVDVGSHTGLYTLTCLKANHSNKVISIEPFYLNMARLITNLRINNNVNNVDTIIAAASNYNGKCKFKIDSKQSYLSKGGKIDTSGNEIQAITLDSLYTDKFTKKIKGIKIDTEGEDLNVLIGSENIIKNFRPKIIIEVRDQNKNEIQDFLIKYNYKIYNVLDKKSSINLSKLNISNVLNIYAENE